MIEEAPVEIRIFAERDSEMGLFFMHKKGGYMGGRGSNSNLGGGSGSGLKTTGLDVTHKMVRITTRGESAEHQSQRL